MVTQWEGSGVAAAVIDAHVYRKGGVRQGRPHISPQLSKKKPSVGGWGCGRGGPPWLHKGSERRKKGGCPCGHVGGKGGSCSHTRGGGRSHVMKGP